MFVHYRNFPFPLSSFMVHFLSSPPKQALSMLREPSGLSRTSYNPYEVQFFSSSSDLMKSTVVDESLSTNAIRVLFQRKNYSLLQETTEWETYIRSLYIFLYFLAYWHEKFNHVTMCQHILMFTFFTWNEL